MKRLKYLLIAIVIALVIPLGLLAPRLLFSEDPPPITGSGALSRVEIINSDKCSATISIYGPGMATPTEAQISLPPGQCNKLTGEEIAQGAEDLLQDELDTCQKLTDLPADDSDKTTDPGTDRLRWEIKADDSYICLRRTEINITWTGKEYTLAWRGVK